MTIHTRMPLIALALFTLSAGPAAAATEKTLYAFNPTPPPGVNPGSGRTCTRSAMRAAR